MKVWQIATGEPNRDYQEPFFDHDIMILGPGRRGDTRTGVYAQVESVTRLGLGDRGSTP